MENSAWDVSDKEIPSYLVYYFGRDAVSKSAESFVERELPGDFKTRAGLLASYAKFPPANLLTRFITWNKGGESPIGPEEQP